MTKLFIVTTIAPAFRGHRDVPISWYVSKRARPPRRSCPKLIAGYDTAPKYLRLYARGALEELFTSEEAETFVAYLHSQYGAAAERTEIKEIELPIPTNTIGLGAIPDGGPVDCLLVAENPCWTLPF